MWWGRGEGLVVEGLEVLWWYLFDIQVSSRRNVECLYAGAAKVTRGPGQGPLGGGDYYRCWLGAGVHHSVPLGPPQLGRAEHVEALAWLAGLAGLELCRPELSLGHGLGPGGEPGVELRELPRLLELGRHAQLLGLALELGGGAGRSPTEGGEGRGSALAGSLGHGLWPGGLAKGGPGRLA